MTRFPLSTVALLLLLGPAAADDLDWRTDYKAARKEATDTGRPLLLDCGTEACGFCRKLDATTFRDPAVIKRLGEKFIAVKIDGHADRQLAEALNVTAYPTLIVATPDGKVVGRHSGYLDAQQLLELLDKTPAASARKAGADLDALYPKIAAALNR